MDQASNHTTSTRTTKTSAVHRRSALRLIAAAPVVATEAIRATTTGASAETTIAAHFALWKEINAKVIDIDRRMTIALAKYKESAPTWPDSLRYSDDGMGWKYYAHRADAIYRDNPSGELVRYLGERAISAVCDRLRRICPTDAPVLAEALKYRDLAIRLEAQEGDVAKITGYDDLESEFDEHVRRREFYESIILGAPPSCADDFKMQAEVLRDRERYKRGNDEMKNFLTSLIDAKL